MVLFFWIGPSSDGCRVVDPLARETQAQGAFDQLEEGGAATASPGVRMARPGSLIPSTPQIGLR